MCVSCLRLMLDWYRVVLYFYGCLMCIWMLWWERWMLDWLGNGLQQKYSYFSSIFQRYSIFLSTSHMHNTRYRINSNFYTPLSNHSKIQKYILYNQVIPIWNSLPSSLKNYTSKFPFKKQIKIDLFASQS